MYIMLCVFVILHSYSTVYISIFWFMLENTVVKRTAISFPCTLYGEITIKNIKSSIYEQPKWQGLRSALEIVWELSCFFSVSGGANWGGPRYLTGEVSPGMLNREETLWQTYDMLEIESLSPLGFPQRRYWKFPERRVPRPKAEINQKLFTIVKRLPSRARPE